MGRFKNKLKIGTAALVVVVALPAFAVDLTAETVLIKKLQNVLARLPENDPSRKDMVLRLADLHAERARLLSVNELEKGCTECNAGTEDRQQAIGLYEKILRTNDGADKGAVYTQLRHLYEMVGEKSKAITAYGYILKNSQDPVAIGEAHLSMGEIYFRQGDFRNAIPHYEKVMAN
ncbi:MAG: tetratricopeptide repeat protein, partial [Bdellovibrionales bacterium]|nr:tetratricopeptide repeat protein [Bdellovibrionales bacterium]